MNQEKIGKFIATQRNEIGLSQRELGEKLGVTDKAVSKWENGRSMPDISIIKDLCKELNISVDELLNGEKNATDIATYKGVTGLMEKSRKMKKWLIVLLIIIGVAITAYITILMAAIGLLTLSSATAKPEVVDNPALYTQVIGKEATGNFENKWDFDERIFPEKISDYKVNDFIAVYYNPFDAQYIAFLDVNLDTAQYDAEVKRLKAIGIEEFDGVYTATGINENYELLACDVDDYQGMIYAMTDGNGRIVYVEMIFCNYFLDLDYTEYIPNEFLPTGFDATMDNDYRKVVMGELQ